MMSVRGDSAPSPRPRAALQLRRRAHRGRRSGDPAESGEAGKHLPDCMGAPARPRASGRSRASPSTLQRYLESSNINFMLVMTETVQDYLKAIWMLDRTGSVSTSALAERLSVTAASATAMIKRLAGVGLVRH